MKGFKQLFFEALFHIKDQLIKIIIEIKSDGGKVQRNRNTNERNDQVT
jgi:hypothetical protein